MATTKTTKAVTKQEIARRKQVSMKKIANETPGQREKRLGPIVPIVKFKKNESGVSRVAILKCGHHRTTDFSKRKTYRCPQCRDAKQRKASPKKAA
jgi:hypothetical protein